MASTIPALFQKWGNITGDATGFGEKVDGNWIETNWREYASLIRRAGCSLVAMGLERADTVAIIGDNRSQWVIADVATMSVGGVSVGVYPACSQAQLAAILDHCEARFVFVGNADQLAMVRQSKAGSVTRIIGLDPTLATSGAQLDNRFMSWVDFLGFGSAVPGDTFASRLASLAPDDLAMLVYTSGTTGAPRAVMLSHDNLFAGTEIGIQMLENPSQDMHSLSYLPLAHIAERGLSVLAPGFLGYSVFFAESTEKLPQNLVEVRPTFFLGVPRVYEKVRDKLEPRLESARGIGGLLVRWARRVAAEYVHCRRRGERPSPRLQRRFKRAHKFVLSRIHRAVGWDKSTTFLTGAAPIDVELLTFFESIGILIQEVYGLSESTGTATFNRPDATLFGTVGRPFDGVDVRLSEDGEILVRGANVFSGYYKDADATAEVLKNGCLHTGDLGEFDDSGFLSITGRRKDVIVTAGGKNVAPRPIERLLRQHPLVREALVIGDRRKFVSALLVLHRDDPDAKGALDEHVRMVNEGLSQPERIKKYAILSRGFEASKGELTPTQKIIRSAVESNFADVIESMYSSDDGA